MGRIERGGGDGGDPARSPPGQPSSGWLRGRPPVAPRPERGVPRLEWRGRASFALARPARSRGTWAECSLGRRPPQHGSRARPEPSELHGDAGQQRDQDAGGDDVHRGLHGGAPHEADAFQKRAHVVDREHGVLAAEPDIGEGAAGAFLGGPREQESRDRDQACRRWPRFRLVASWDGLSLGGFGHAAVRLVAAAGQRSWNVGVWSSPTIGMLIRIRFSVVETVIASSCSASRPTWPSRRYWKAVRTVSTPVPSAAKIVVRVEMRDDVGHQRPAVDLAAHVAGPARAGELPEEAVELEVRPLLVRIVREGLADVDQVQRGERRRGVVAGHHEVAVGGRGIRAGRQVPVVGA